jgi:molybdate transport system regulatory protein
MVDLAEEVRMQTSARNQLSGTVTAVTMGAVMAEVVVDVNGAQVVAAITKESAERLGLADGMSVTAIIKATDVMIGVG